MEAEHFGFLPGGAVRAECFSSIKRPEVLAQLWLLSDTTGTEVLLNAMATPANMAKAPGRGSQSGALRRPRENSNFTVAQMLRLSTAVPGNGYMGAQNVGNISCSLQLP